MFTRTRTALIAVAILAPFLVPTAVNAQSGPATCGGDTLTPVNFPNVGFNAGVAATIVSGNSYYNRSKTVAADVPAGEYIINTVAYDGYDDRVNTVPQMYEQYVLQFIDDAGIVIAGTGMTADLVDGVSEAQWSGSVGTVVLNRPAVAIRARHAFANDAAVNAEGGANSVQPVCVGFSLVPPPTTTTTTTSTTTTTTTSTTTTSTTTTTEPPVSTTTEPPVSTTTEPPVSTTTIEPPSSTTIAPTTTTTAPPTTTTTILPPTPPQPMDPEDPVDGDPTFTG
ncbi:MAG: hypothetical protein R8F63_15665 [Acidimicrobiales bacterium]|nr:hypothetical protein [Acidimicrobiales bacterium]